MMVVEAMPTPAAVKPLAKRAGDVEESGQTDLRSGPESASRCRSRFFRWLNAIIPELSRS